ncbi:MAG: glycosyltransferase family 4 protein [Candidatus Omnitrophota bacterium]
MKFCYLSSVLTVHDRRFLEGLVKRGDEVYLVTYYDGELPEEIKSLDGVRIIHRKPRYFHNLQKFLFATKVNDFRRILKEIQPDIVQGGFVWKDGFLAALSGFHPFVLMPWGSDILKQPQASILCRWIVKYTINRADVVICDCMTVKRSIKELTDYPKEKILIFPWGIDSGVFKPGDSLSSLREELDWKDKKVLISTRSFYPVYGIDLFIKALPEVLRSEPLARVILIGAGPEEERLRGMVADNGLGDVVHFAGTVDNIKIPEYLKAADVYVSSSLSDGTSISLLEAFACGLPVVVNDVPAVMEWVRDGENGFITKIGDTEEFSQNIKNLLADPGLRKKMGENNLKVVSEKGDWEKNFDVLHGIYENIVRG